MKNKVKMKINTKLDLSKPITADKLRSYPAKLDQAETPEHDQIMMENASFNGSAETPETSQSRVIQNMKDNTYNASFLPEMLSITEAAARTNLSYEYLRLLCYSGKINHLKCGRKYMIDSGSLADFIKRGGADQ